jgi:holo-[acyl-carrier protein] synthase
MVAGEAAGEEIAVGVDVVMVADVARSLRSHGERYRRRLYTDHELGCCEGSPGVEAQGLAARFAAKEAVIKVLRPEDGQPDWRSIEIRRQAGGWCSVALTGTARRLASARGLGEIAVSLSHEGPIAVVVAVACPSVARRSVLVRSGKEEGS